MVVYWVYKASELGARAGGPFGLRRPDYGRADAGLVRTVWGRMLKI